MIRRQSLTIDWKFLTSWLGLLTSPPLLSLISAWGIPHNPSVYRCHVRDVRKSRGTDGVINYSSYVNFHKDLSVCVYLCFSIIYSLIFPVSRRTDGHSVRVWRRRRSCRTQEFEIEQSNSKKKIDTVKNLTSGVRKCGNAGNYDKV